MGIAVAQSSAQVVKIHRQVWGVERGECYCLLIEGNGFLQVFHLPRPGVAIVQPAAQVVETHRQIWGIERCTHHRLLPTVERLVQVFQASCGPVAILEDTTGVVKSSQLETLRGCGKEWMVQDILPGCGGLVQSNPVAGTEIVLFGFLHLVQVSAELVGNEDTHILTSCFFNKGGFDTNIAAAAEEGAAVLYHLASSVAFLDGSELA